MLRIFNIRLFSSMAMFIDILLIAITLIILLISSFTDIKTREVPDWVSYSFLSTVVGIRLIFSIEYGYPILLSGLLGFTVCFLLAHLLYYTRQWGGGDSKILMGMGASIGITYPFTQTSFNLLLFFIFLLFVGAIYGLIWMFVIAFRNKTLFLKTFHQKLNLRKHLHYFILSLTLLSIIISLFSPLFWPFIILIPLFFYLLLFVSCIEEHFFHKQTPITNLSEGDWLAESITIQNHTLFHPKTLEKSDLITLKQLHSQKKLSTVLIKEGIPFLPSFLFAYIIIIVLTNSPSLFALLSLF